MEETFVLGSTLSSDWNSNDIHTCVRITSDGLILGSEWMVINLKAGLHSESPWPHTQRSASLKTWHPWWYWNLRRFFKTKTKDHPANLAAWGTLRILPETGSVEGGKACMYILPSQCARVRDFRRFQAFGEERSSLIEEFICTTS